MIVWHDLAIGTIRLHYVPYVSGQVNYVYSSRITSLLSTSRGRYGARIKGARGAAHLHLHLRGLVEPALVVADGEQAVGAHGVQGRRSEPVRKGDVPLHTPAVLLQLDCHVCRGRRYGDMLRPVARHLEAGQESHVLGNLRPVARNADLNGGDR